MTAIVIVALVLVALYFLTRERSTPTITTSTRWEISTGWEIGPVVNGENYSSGATLSKGPDGVSFDIPYPNPQAGGVHYVTRVPAGPLTDNMVMRLRFRLDMDPGAKLVPCKFPDALSIISLYFQRSGDNFSAQGEFEAYRWYAGFASMSPVVAGVHTIEAPLNGPWGAVLGSTRASNPEGFAAAMANVCRVGFVIGGGDGLGHGVYATGPARMTILNFEVGESEHG